MLHLIFYAALVATLPLYSQASEITSGKPNVYTAITSSEFSDLSPKPSLLPVTRFFQGLVHRPLQVRLVAAQKKPSNGLGYLQSSDIAYVGYSCQVPKGLRWADHAPIEAADIYLTWQKNRSISRGSQEGGESSKFQLDPLDALSFRIFFASGQKEGIKSLNDWFLYSAHLQDLPEATYQTEKQNPGLYNGPFILSAFLANQKLEFLPNPAFEEAQPTFTPFMVEFSPIFYDIAGFFKKTQADVILPFGLNLGRFLKMEPFLIKSQPKFQVKSQPTQKLARMIFSLKDPILAEARVRRALYLATDQEAINAKIFKGMHHTQKDFLHLHGNDPAKRPDLEFASRLLNEAGWKLTKGGRFRRGKKLTLNFYTNKESETRVLVFKLLKDQWAQLGVDLVLKVLDASQFFGQTLKQAQFDGIAAFSDDFGPSLARDYWHRESIPEQQNSFSGKNYGAYRNEAVDKILDSLAQDGLRSKARAQIFEHLEKSVQQDPPWIPLYLHSEYLVYRSEVPQWLDLTPVPIEINCFRL